MIMMLRCCYFYSFYKYLFFGKKKEKIGFRNRKKIGFQNSNRKKRQTKMNHSFTFGNNTNTKHKQSLPHFMRNVTVDICGSTANLRGVTSIHVNVWICPMRVCL